MDTETTPPVENAPVETESAVESASAPPPEEESAPTNPSEEREHTIQGLIDALRADAELQEDQTLNNDEVYKGIKYKDTLQNLDDDAKKLLSNMRSDYTRKSQELSDQRKAMEVQMKELQAQKDALMESDYYKTLQSKASEEVDFNPWDESSVESRIEQEVAKRLEEMMRPMQNEYAVRQREAQLTQFKADHPDMMDYKHEIVEVLQQNEGMRLEQAYWLIKGQKLDAKMKHQDQELRQYKSAAREAGLKVGGLSRGRNRGVPDHVRQGSAFEIYKYLANKKKS